jgi:hypothetical protein
MSRKTTGIALVLIILTIQAFSQRQDSVKVRLNHYSFTIGTGWTHYYNNLENGDQNLKQDFAGVSLKFFWEPQYRLSLGLEAGYYKLFKSTTQLGEDTALVVNRSVVPLMLLVRMRIVDHLYLTAGMGLAIIYSDVSVLSDKINTNTLSLSNYEFAASYLYPLSKHWQVGGEVKLYNFGKFEDWMYGIHALCAFRL